MQVSQEKTNEKADIASIECPVLPAGHMRKCFGIPKPQKRVTNLRKLVEKTLGLAKYFMSINPKKFRVEYGLGVNALSSEEKNQGEKS